MNNALFPEYNDIEELKPPVSLGSMLGIGIKEMKKQLQDKVDNMVKKERGITNERQSIIKEYVDEINMERVKTKYKPITARAIAIKLGTLKTNQELYAFLSECRDYKKRHGSFGRRFFGGLKAQSWKSI